MKNKNTIESLKKEKLITTADTLTAKHKIIPIKLLSTKEDLGTWNNENSFFDETKINKQIERLQTLEIVEDYCSSLGITPADLIALHKELSNKRNLKAKTTREMHVSDFTKESSIGKPYKPSINEVEGHKIENKSRANWREDLIERKTGYNPNK